MSEQELKLHVPQTAWLAVKQDVMRGHVTRVRLKAQYFDTPNRDLAQNNISLRLRLEGRRWVQTLKMPGAHALDRIEINHPRPNPTLDLSALMDSPAYRTLERFSESLKVAYETDIVRLYRRTRTQGAVIEIALDSGVIQSGELTLPVREIEFERISGPIDALFVTGKRWQTKHGLLLDLRSKAERGDRLATLGLTLGQLKEANQADAQSKQAAAVAQFWGTTGIDPIALNAHMSCDHALSVISQSCLAQVARNAAVLAEIDTRGVCQAGTSEHLHQLRVGLRRLRSAWSLFNELAHLPDPTLRDEIRSHFAQMGNTRDEDVLRETVMPVLNAAGQPPLFLKKPDQTLNGSTLAASKPFQRWLIDMLAFNVKATESEPLSEVPLKVAVRKRLHKWHQKVVARGVEFDSLPIETKHDLRKKTKRLRYGLQFAESLLPRTRLKHYRKDLAVIQDVLGEMNDLYVARDRFNQLKNDQPPAWFAVGWIASRLDVLARDAQKGFDALKRADHFWSKA